MKLCFGVAACLLAGCATQPVTWGHNAGGTPPDGTAILAAATGTVLRIGVEYLPPEQPTADRPEVDRSEAGRPAPPAPAPKPPSRQSLVADVGHTWALSTADLNAIDNPFERETLHFIDDLLREDRRSTEREVRLPFLDWQRADLGLSQQLWSETTIAEAQDEWIHDNGPAVLAKPMRRLLQRLPVVTELELSLDGFRSSFVPLSEPYRETHRSGHRLGRLSVRLDADDLADPVELVYIRSGIRIGSSQERGKVSIQWPLTETISLWMRARRDYADSDTRLRADLAYRFSPATSFRLAAGDDMDFLSTSSIYSIFETPMDGAAGVLLYAVHIF